LWNSYGCDLFDQEEQDHIGFIGDQNTADGAIESTRFVGIDDDPHAAIRSSRQMRYIRFTLVFMAYLFSMKPKP